jgi:hypothetical protein
LGIRPGSPQQAHLREGGAKSDGKNGQQQTSSFRIRIPTEQKKNVEREQQQ